MTTTKMTMTTPRSTTVAGEGSLPGRMLRDAGEAGEEDLVEEVEVEVEADTTAEAGRACSRRMTAGVRRGVAVEEVEEGQEGQEEHLGEEGEGEADAPQLL